MVADHGIPNLHVSTSWKENGDFEISGQHLGAGSIVGREDYEYYVTVRSGDLGALAAALETEVAGIQAAWQAREADIVRAGETKWLTSHGIAHELYVA